MQIEKEYFTNKLIQYKKYMKELDDLSDKAFRNCKDDSVIWYGEEMMILQGKIDLIKTILRECEGE